jgi:hypothetical protein
MLGQRRPVTGSLFLYIPDPRSRIPDPGSRIPDPTAARKEEGKNTVHPLFFVARNNKIKNYYIIEQLQKNVEPICKEL